MGLGFQGQQWELGDPGQEHFTPGQGPGYIRALGNDSKSRGEVNRGHHTESWSGRATGKGMLSWHGKNQQLVLCT